MEQIKTEDILMELVVNSGNARSSAMEAIKLAKEGNFDESEKSLELAKEQIKNAHEFQTSLVMKEAGGEKVELSLLMCHGQDHLMTAMVVIDLAEEFIALYKTIREK